MEQALAAVFEMDASAGDRLQSLMRALAQALNADRCVLFMRDPATHRSRSLHRWAAKPEFALERPDRGWQPISDSLPRDDPMYAEALVNPEALFIDDIETADPALVNAAYEREHFGHRALVHAPVYHESDFYGVLEPCVMESPRAWSDADKALIADVQRRIGPLAAEFVRMDTAA